MLSKGICIYNPNNNSLEYVDKIKSKFDLKEGNVFDFDINMVYTPNKLLDLDLIRHCFDWIRKWEVIAPFGKYTTLIKDIVEEKDKKYLESIMWDLRVPVYDTRVIFLRKLPNIEEFWEIYLEEIEKLKDNRLAFSVALWKIKPMILTLSNRFNKEQA